MFGRYVFRQALGSFLLIVISLTAVMWIATALRQLSIITSQGQDALMFVRMTLLALPNLVAMIGPIALLIAVLHTLNRLNGDSELIVMAASGATVWKAGRPLLLLSVLVMVFVAFGNFYLMPWSMRTLQDYVIKIRTDLISQVLQPGEFTSPEDGLTFHIAARDRNGDLRGLVMRDSREANQEIAYIAERGRIMKSGESAYLVMNDGQVIERGEAASDISLIEFDSYLIDLSEFTAKTADPGTLKPRARYIGELLAPPPEDPLYKSRPGQFHSELHDRFASILYPLAFVLIALAYLGRARTNRQGRIGSIVAAFVVATLVRIGGIVATNLITINAAAAPLAYAVPLLAIVAAGWSAQRQMAPRRQSRLELLFGRIHEAAMERFWRPLFRLLWRRRRSAGNLLEAPTAASAVHGSARSRS